MQDPSLLDCLIVGGGPAGLTAALYLARFRRKVLLVDSGAPRAALIPESHNCAGFPYGIGGPALLDRLRTHADRYNVAIMTGTVTKLARDSSGNFSATIEDEGRLAYTVHSRAIVLATGVIDIEPKLPNLERAIAEGYVRHCPICDGYEVIGQKIGVIGLGDGGVGEAHFMRTYSSDITLLTLGQPMNLSAEDRQGLETAGIKIEEEPAVAVSVEECKLAALHLASGRELRFDTVYSALGARVRSELALSLGAAHDEREALIVDEHQRTSVSGLWAAGDVVDSLNQIGVAVGQASVAAVDVHRELGVSPEVSKAPTRSPTP